jgi:hypothetical protein
MTAAALERRRESERREEERRGEERREERRGRGGRGTNRMGKEHEAIHDGHPNGTTKGHRNRGHQLEHTRWDLVGTLLSHCVR